MERRVTHIVLGAWLVLSPWLLGFSLLVLAKWSAVLVGLVFIILNAWDIFSEKVEKNK